MATVPFAPFFTVTTPCAFTVAMDVSLLTHLSFGTVSALPV